jgi:putative ABC transport system ATP-binding protein
MSITDTATSAAALPTRNGAGGGGIRVRALVKRFAGHGALQGVALDVAAATTTAVMGPSGSGKSTLLHVIGGLLRPTSGTVSVDGVEISGLDDDGLAAHRGRTGFVFQAFHLVDALPVLDNVMLPAVLARRVDGIEAQALELLGAVGLVDRAQARPGDLSGGERQRVAIARALVLGPSVVLADEPTGSLDSANAEAVLALLRELQQLHGFTMLIATHDPAVAAAADRVVVLRDGDVHADVRPSGTARQRAQVITRALGGA